MNIVTKILFHLSLIKHLFSWLHKWGIANDPAIEDEHFAETYFVERFGRRRQSQPKTSAPSVISGANQQLVKIRVNSWIFNTQYEQRHPSTTVENSLQIDLFMQNKPKVKYAQINVSSFITSKYEKMDTWLSGKNKPKTKPKQTQTKPNPKKPKMNVNSIITNDYEEIC